VPGLYLLVIVVSAAGVALLDARYRLALWARPLTTAIAVFVGTAFFVVWDLVGIAAGVFVQGDSPLYLGIELAPHLPLEEITFLLFLCYLAAVCAGAGSRLLARKEPR